MLSDCEIVAVGIRVGFSYANYATWLDKEEVAQEAATLALEIIKNEYKYEFDSGDNKKIESWLGWRVKNRLIDWQRMQKVLYSGRQNPDRGKSIRVRLEEYDEIKHGVGVFDLGYWFIEEINSRPLPSAKGKVKRIYTLSEREKEILTLLATGNTRNETAIACSISLETVKSHCKNIMAKQQSRNTAHAVAIALRKGEIQ